MDSNGCILILILTNWPISRVQWYPMFECFWPIAISCFCCGAQEDVYWASCGQELLTGQRQRAASESGPHSVGSLGEGSALHMSHWGKPLGEATRKNPRLKCWGMLGVSPVVTACHQNDPFLICAGDSLYNGETAFCMQFLQQFPANQWSLHKGTFNSVLL